MAVHEAVTASRTGPQLLLPCVVPVDGGRGTALAGDGNSRCTCANSTADASNRDVKSSRSNGGSQTSAHCTVEVLWVLV